MSVRRPAQAFAFAVVLVVAGTGCLGRGGGAADGGFLAAEVSGSILARFPSGEARALRKGDDVPAGTLLKTGPDGFVKLEGAEGQLVELQNDSQATFTEAQRATLESGRALGQAGAKQAFTIDSRGTVVRIAPEAATRVERLLGALRVGVYRGSARVELLGRGVDVPGLREVVIAGGVPLERAPRPLTLSAQDRWDRMLLGDVLDFDRELTQYGAGFNSEFGARPLAPRFFATFVTTLPSVGFIRPELPTTEPAEVLFGAVFAQLLSTRAGGPATIPVFFDELLGLRDLGASWGLIAKEKNLDLRLALQGVVDSIRQGTEPTPPPGSGGSGGGSGGGGSGGGGGGGSTPGPEPSPSPTASPTEPPPEEPPPPEECSVLEILLGTCDEGAAGDPKAAASEECSVVAVLIDPTC